ncbi:hypothetical protein Nepgr_015646 [Nepenthes gracilis]|uniref:BRI1 kinase inhibitor 1 n=1 Tax=Nepenthes gracilis TaxID=150966 RepID=A0AAD3SLD5_NEPGR|nr:hypothetical protein Nepgr_015646 [Nepenthes gracilis]
METQSEGKASKKPARQQAGEPTSMASPPSATTSPSHEFSFTISMQSCATPCDKAKAHQPPLAIDLSPADDIFFHGRLLPLHLLSNIPTTSPRSSTNSFDSFTLPITEFLGEEEEGKASVNDLSKRESNNYNSKNHHESNNKERSKNKSFLLLGLKRWRSKGSEGKEGEGNEKQKRKLRFDLTHFLKRYLRMMSPVLFFKGRREDIELHRQPYSFSGNLCPKERRDLRGRRGEFSAPASMRTSPTNSGLLLAKAGLPSPSNDSTMEELQAAIQAAIAHCKNSIASDEKLKSQEPPS